MHSEWTNERTNDIVNARAHSATHTRVRARATQITRREIFQNKGRLARPDRRHYAIYTCEICRRWHNSPGIDAFARSLARRYFTPTVKYQRLVPISVTRVARAHTRLSHPLIIAPAKIRATPHASSSRAAVAVVVHEARSVIEALPPRRGNDDGRARANARATTRPDSPRRKRPRATKSRWNRTASATHRRFAFVLYHSPVLTFAAIFHSRCTSDVTVAHGGARSLSNDRTDDRTFIVIWNRPKCRSHTKS